MTDARTQAVLNVFQSAAKRVPAYQTLLSEAGIDPQAIQTLEDFSAKVPYADKASTFGRFTPRELCLDGDLESPISLLTSSGHSGLFAYGLYHESDAIASLEAIDATLDRFFAVKSQRTLLINGLPMGVKVATRACTLAETSVRPDMILALVKAFAGDFDQIILLGETAFIKHVLELGVSQGIRWPDMRVHVITGEEPIAVNAAIYLEELLGIDPRDPKIGIVVSSMGIAEIGLNLFFEAPPLNLLRRALHLNSELRALVAGADHSFAPMLFTYDPMRIYPEIRGQGELVLSSLDPNRRLPLVRYVTGDCAVLLQPGPKVDALTDAVGISRGALQEVPLMLILGRGNGLVIGESRVVPEQIKEGLYQNHELARQVTANFRMSLLERELLVRVQLIEGVPSSPALVEALQRAMEPYLGDTPFRLELSEYEAFRDGLLLDYERKWAYLS